MKKIMLVFGTRPEAIKMCPLVNELKKNKYFDVKVCVTAQHREMLDKVLEIFNVIPDYDLDIMSHGQSIQDVSCKVLKGVDEVLKIETPDLVLVHGDTSTTLAAGMAAFYNKVPVGHVEAGLRSGNIYSPYPEEFNRKLVGHFAEFHFAPTQGNKENLLKEGVPEAKIYVTGNTVIDALKSVIDKNYIFQDDALNNIDYENKKVLLITAHRRENWGEPMDNIFSAIKEIALENKDVIAIFPMHKNPLIRKVANRILGDVDNILLIEPLDYLPFANLMAKSYLIATDSGGIQEEAPALGKPVIVLRTETERPEAVDAGTVKISGVEKSIIKRDIKQLLENKEEYKKMSNAVNPYGVGDSCKKIIEVLEGNDNKIPKIIHYCWFGKNKEPELMKKCIESWKKNLPDYELMLWDEETFDVTSNKFTEEAYKMKKWAFITDYVRLYALFNYGGVYMDTDVEILKGIDIFLEDDAFSGFEDEQYIPTGIMGAKKGNAWIESLLEYYNEKSFINSDNSLEITPNTKIITDISTAKFDLKINNEKQVLKNNSAVIYPKDYFCPKSHYSGRINITKNTYAIHHFSGSWKTPKDKLKQKIHMMLILILGENNHQKLLKKLKGIRSE